MKDAINVLEEHEKRNETLLDTLEKLAALILWRVGVMDINFEKPFVLASGKKSPIYIDCRLVLGDNLHRSALVELLCLLIGVECEFDVCRHSNHTIAGGVTAGVPLASCIAEHLRAPLIYVRKKDKAHGKTKLVEGMTTEVLQGEHVILVEDLITDGGSKLKFLDALIDAGVIVRHCVVLFNRQQGGKETLAKYNVELHSLVTIAAFLRYGLEASYVDKVTYDKVITYLASPDKWDESLEEKVHE